MLSSKEINLTEIYLDDAMKEVNVDPTDVDLVKVGSSNSHTETRKDDGSFRLRGDATAWIDMISDLFGRRLTSVAGKVDYDWDNNSIIFQSGGSVSVANDRVQGNQEINHNFKVGTGITFKPHIHWFQEVVSHTPDVLDTKVYTLTAKYRILRNGQGINLTDPWTQITAVSNLTNNVFDASLAGGKDYIGQITRFQDITIDCSVSDTIQWQIARTDTELGNILVYFFDIHGENDSFGSETEFIKGA